MYKWYRVKQTILQWLGLRSRGWLFPVEKIDENTVRVVSISVKAIGPVKLKIKEGV